MAQPINPYVAGAPAQGNRGFFGRQDVLEWVTRGLRNPAANSLVLFGQRRIGKTSLLLQLERSLPGDLFLPVYFDLHDQAARPLGATLADMAEAVAERAGLEPPSADAFDDRGLFFGRTFLPQVCTYLGKERRLVFLLDEFDVLSAAQEAELPPTAAIQSLYRLIRRVITQNSRAAFVFALGRRVDDLNVDFTATFKAALVREVWVLDRGSAEAMVRQAEKNAPGGAATLRFTQPAVERVLQLTSGHPYLTQILCREVWERAHADGAGGSHAPQVDAPDVEAAVPGALEAADPSFAWVWEGLSLAERIYAAGMAGAVGENETLSEERCLQILADHAARLCTREVELSAPRDLVRRRVLELAAEQEHSFAVELFRRWMRERRPLWEVKEELDRVDPLADELYGIGQEFFRRNQWETAVRYFRDALAANPHHFRARLRLGETLLNLSRTEDAVVELEWAYRQDRNEARIPLVRALGVQARTREEAGDEQGALAACERALQISPNDPAAQKIRGGIVARRGEMDARAHEQAGRWAEAAALYEQLTEYAGDDESRERWKADAERCRKEQHMARLFREGMGALEKRNWARAQRAFAEVVHGRPDYRVGKQTAARLLWRAVQQKPLRRLGLFSPALLLPALLMIALGVAATLYFRGVSGSAQARSPLALPAGWLPVRVYRLDVNQDRHEEWVTLYRFDAPAEGAGGPIGGVVDQQEGDAPKLVRYELRPQGGDYLCECECEAAMEDVLSGLAGDELVVRDRCGDETTRLSIFYWDPKGWRYAAKGHFSGSRIEIGLNSVVVSQRLPHRAQLAFRQTYRARNNETYYQSDDIDILVMPGQYEITFYRGEPEDVTRSPYPEKVVLAFYQHYGWNTPGQVTRYFARDAWERLGGCAAERCGCAAPPGEVAHVRVTDLQLIEPVAGADEEHPADHALVESTVVCEQRDGATSDEVSVRWKLVLQDGRWKLDDAERSPAAPEAREE